MGLTRPNVEGVNIQAILDDLIQDSLDYRVVKTQPIQTSGPDNLMRLVVIAGVLTLQVKFDGKWYKTAALTEA